MDDDTYVNTGALLRLLRKHNHTSDWYLGKPSLSHPLQIQDKENPGVSKGCKTQYCLYGNAFFLSLQTKEYKLETASLENSKHISQVDESPFAGIHSFVLVLPVSLPMDIDKTHVYQYIQYMSIGNEIGSPNIKKCMPANVLWVTVQQYAIILFIFVPYGPLAGCSVQQKSIVLSYNTLMLLVSLCCMEG